MYAVFLIAANCKRMYIYIKPVKFAKNIKQMNKLLFPNYRDCRKKDIQSSGYELLNKFF